MEANERPTPNQAERPSLHTVISRTPIEPTTSPDGGSPRPSWRGGTWSKFVSSRALRTLTSTLAIIWATASITTKAPSGLPSPGG
jgi:hypothetical protein